MSKLSISWSYRLHPEAVASAADSSSFAALVLLPESSKYSESSEKTLRGRDGVILFFNVADPVPVATCLVNKTKGGSLAFLQVNQSSAQENIVDGKTPKTLLTYINGDHEYVLFDPHEKDTDELRTIKRDDVLDMDERGNFGYASIYGELPEYDLKRTKTSSVPSAPSERPWESIFSGSSHNLLPLTKLCSAFLESLLEKRTTVLE